MKPQPIRQLLLPVLILLFTLTAQSQVKTLKAVKELKITGTKGSNGANVVWHPKRKLYYAAMAGNKEYPMEVYDAKGVSLSGNTQKTNFDVRGLWYNAKTQTLQTNGYDESGWGEYQLNEKGFPVSVKVLVSGRHQPDEQAVGFYDAKLNRMGFFSWDEGKVMFYKAEDGTALSSVTLYLGVKDKKDMATYSYENVSNNYTMNTIVFTGKKGAEVGLLNMDKKQIELYSLSTGMVTKVFALPAEAPIPTSFNFSYTNGMFWLFDKSNRKWIGYK